MHLVTLSRCVCLFLFAVIGCALTHTKPSVCMCVYADIGSALHHNVQSISLYVCKYCFTIDSLWATCVHLSVCWYWLCIESSWSMFAFVFMCACAAISCALSHSLPCECVLFQTVHSQWELYVCLCSVIVLNWVTVSREYMGVFFSVCMWVCVCPGLGCALIQSEPCICVFAVISCVWVTVNHVYICVSVSVCANMG